MTDSLSWVVTALWYVLASRGNGSRDTDTRGKVSQGHSPSLNQAQNALRQRHHKAKQAPAKLGPTLAGFMPERALC